jgi:hypothetical protein
MKKLFLFLALIMTIATIYSQVNLKVVKYILLEALPQKITQLDTILVPEGEIWKIESALCQNPTEYVSLVIKDNAYIIGLHEAEDRPPPKLPFYLPGGTEFRLGAWQGSGIVSICVLKFE